MTHCTMNRHDELTGKITKTAAHLESIAERLRRAKQDIVRIAENSNVNIAYQNRVLDPVLEQWSQLAALCEDVSCLLESARQRSINGETVENFPEILRVARLTVNVMMEEQQRSLDVLRFLKEDQ